MTDTCADLEAEHRNSPSKCTAYRTRFPDCACEACSVAPGLSPGPVSTDEILLREIRSREWLDPEIGGLKPAALSDVKDRGLSVHRLKHADRKELTARLASSPVAIVRCSDVKALTASQGSPERLFCIYDSAKPGDPAHADICQALVTPPGTARRDKLDKQLRFRLLELFQVVTLDRAYALADDGRDLSP